MLANATSLAQVLAQRNIINTANTFHEFINGFNAVDELVTFTNVGRGKELVDTKIKGLTLAEKTDAAMLEMFASWPQCQNVLFGGSHDNGYARILSKLETDNIMPGKVRLVQGPPFATELAQLSSTYFPRIEFSDVFMATKLEQECSVSYLQVAMDGVLKVPRKSQPSTVAIEPANESCQRLPDKGITFCLLR